MTTTYTDAPEAYDGFGTRTVNVHGKYQGRAVREVETPDEHAEWQRGRYASGTYLALDQDQLRRFALSLGITLEP